MCQVFNVAASPVLESFYGGQNALIFAYGITNSGANYLSVLFVSNSDQSVLPTHCLDVIHPHPRVSPHLDGYL